MKINVNTMEFQAAAAKLLKVTPKRSSIAILEGLLVNVTPDAVTLTATDCDVRASITLAGPDIVEAGSIVIPAETLKLVARLKSTTLTLSDGVIISDNRRLNFTGLDAESFPHSTVNFIKPAFTLPAADFINIIDIRYACADSEVTPILTGVLIRELSAVACDRHRLAIKPIAANLLTNDIVIPADALNIVQSFMPKKYAGDIVATVDIVRTSPDDTEHRNIRLTFDNVTIDTRLIDGNYPDVSKIIPQTFSESFTVKRSTLVDELALMRDMNKLKSVKMLSAGGVLSLAAAQDGGENELTSEVPVKFTQGLGIVPMSFNADYVLDGLKHNVNEYVTLNIAGKTSPFMIDNDCLVLPYRVAN